MKMTRLFAGMVTTLVLAGCSHTPGLPTATMPTAKSLSAANSTMRVTPQMVSDPERPTIEPDETLPGRRLTTDDVRLGLTPEKAQVKADERALEWRADAEIRFVAWEVIKWQPLSVTNHVYYSKSANEVLIVNTVLRDKWQFAKVFKHPIVVYPATKWFQPVGDYKVKGAQAIKLMRIHTWIGGNPLFKFITLSKPGKLDFPFWGALTTNKFAFLIFVHAQTGQSISPIFIDPFPKEWLL